MSNFSIDNLSIDDSVKSSLHELSSSIDFTRGSHKGANGYVFFGFNTILERKFAVKYYYWGGDRRYHVEPKTLAQVKSPYVVEVLHADILGDDWALFMTPFCEGGDLDDALARGPLPLRLAVDFTTQILTGVSALHAKKLVHRDLKPENILLKNSDTTLISDFGSVKQLSERRSKVSASGHSIIYRPPESFKNDEYGQRGDLYQCGILLYQLLGGDLPYNEEAWLDKEQIKEYNMILDRFTRSRFVDSIIMKKITNGKLLRFESLPAWIPASLQKILRKSTSVDEEKRFGTTSEFLEKLHNIRNQLLDWRVENRCPTLILRDRKIQVIRDSTANIYAVRQNRGRGWRNDSSFGRGDLSQQIQAITQRFTS